MVQKKAIRKFNYPSNYNFKMKSIVILILAFGFSFLSNEQETTIIKTGSQETDAKVEAHKVLELKCNACHQKKNRYSVYTLENMDESGPDIYKQVFIKKRMPKGNKDNLTQEEYDQLETWLMGLESVKLKTDKKSN